MAGVHRGTARQTGERTEIDPGAHRGGVHLERLRFFAPAPPRHGSGITSERPEIPGTYPIARLNAVLFRRPVKRTVSMEGDARGGDRVGLRLRELLPPRDGFDDPARTFAFRGTISNLSGGSRGICDTKNPAYLETYYVNVSSAFRDRELRMILHRFPEARRHSRDNEGGEP